MFPYNYKPRKKKKTRFWPYSLFTNGTKKLCALVILLTVGVVIYPREIHKTLSSSWNEVISKLKIPLDEIEIDGLERVAPEEVAHLIDFNIGDNIYSIDLSAVREQLEKYPWIASAIVERKLPATIRISISEERPKAVFITNNARYFVNENGKLIEKITDISTGEGYIYLSGEGANLTYSDILDDIYHSEEIYQRVEGLIKVGQRRWDLKLKNDITLKLPQNNLIESLSKFSKLIDDNIDFFKSGTIIDLRFMPEKIYIK